MSLVFVSRPIKTISATASPWVAARNPVVYALQRKDQAFNQINDSSGDIQIQINGVDVSSSFTAGDQVYLQSDNGVYDLVCTVATSSFSTNTLVTMEEAYISAAPGGFVNFITTRPSYNVQVQVYNESDDSEIGPVLQFSPLSDGSLNVDVSAVPQSFLSPDNDYDFAGADVQADGNAWVGFYIGTTERWTGSAESESLDNSNVVYAAFASRQIGDSNGSNLYDYSVADDFKFLSKFVNNLIWSGRKFLLSLINTNDAYDLTIVRRTDNQVNSVESLALSSEGIIHVDISPSTEKTIALQVLDGLSTTQVLTNNEFATDLTDWDSFGSGVTWEWANALGGEARTSTALTNSAPESEIRHQEISITPGIINININVTSQLLFDVDSKFHVVAYDGVTHDVLYTLDITTEDSFNIDEDIQILKNYTHIGFYSEISLETSGVLHSVSKFDLILKTQGATTVSELLTLTVKQPCQNPVQLMWRNSLGGLSTWVFDFNQEIDMVYRDDRKYKRMILFAENITTDQWNALNELITLGETYRQNIIELTESIDKTDVRVGQQVYMIDTDGNKTGVIVNATNQQMQTRDTLHTFVCEILLPEIL